MRKLATLAASLVLASPVFAQGQTWAVVVGIDNYTKEGIPALHYAGADAKIFAQALQSLLKVPKEHLYLFTSDSVESGQSPSRLNLVYRLDWLSKNTKPDDVVIFYFAGHGAQVEGTSFLLTDDSDPRSLETLKASALNTADLNRLIDRTSAAKTLTVLDACRNNPSGGRDEYSVAAQFALTGKGKEVVGLVSCSPGQRSWEWEEKKHGFFTYYLVEAMQGKAGVKGNITPSSLAEYLTVQVPAQTLSTVRQQQNPRLFYDGPSSTGWVLGKAPDTATPMKDLEAQAARAELLQAEKTELEARLRAEEARRRQVELRLEMVERNATTVGIKPSEEVQKLALARDLAMKELFETKKELETVRVQLAARGGPTAETELMLAEREQLKAENKVLQAKVTLLESRLHEGKVTSMARSFTLEENGPLSARVLEMEKLALADPREENRKQLADLQVEKELQASMQYRREMDRLTTKLDEQVLRLGRELAESSASNLALLEKLRQLETANADLHRANETLKLEANLWDSEASKASSGKRLAENQLELLNSPGRSRSLELARAKEQNAFQGYREESRRLLAVLRDVVKSEPGSRRWISRRFREINSMPGMGDILDVPVQVGPELQSLP